MAKAILPSALLPGEILFIPDPNSSEYPYISFEATDSELLVRSHASKDAPGLEEEPIDPEDADDLVKSARS